MSLYTRMLNTNTVTVKEAAYGHEEGAFAIAMESAQELYAIFRESTYESEQAELAAVSEGVVLEGSQYEVVKENAITKGFAKIKEFLQKLWAKVKAFFANVVRFLDGIFKSGKEFATKYEKDLLALGNKLDGFEYNMYKYDHAQIDKASKDIDVEKTKKTAEDSIKAFDLTGTPDDKISESVKACKEMIEDDIKLAREALTGTKEEDDQAEAIFKMFRSGATGESDKEDIKISIRDIIKVLKDSKPDNIKSVQSKTDTMYSKAIKFIDDKAKEAEKADTKVQNGYAEILRAFSSAISTEQTIHNAVITGQKTAFAERSNVYKQVCLAAFRYKKDK